MEGYGHWPSGLLWPPERDRHPQDAHPNRSEEASASTHHEGPATLAATTSRAFWSRARAFSRSFTGFLSSSLA